MDIDEFDTMENGCRQLVVWNPDDEEIIGGYRYLYGRDWKTDESGQPVLATGHMFHFSDQFMRDYAPHTVELGRSFVSLDYQNVRANTKSIFALDNLWDGLGALIVINPDCRYFFGKMTMYPSFSKRGRDMILYFLHKHFRDDDKLIVPMKPLKTVTPEEELAHIFCEDDFRRDYRILNHQVRELGYNIPPLVNAYMNLSPTMKFFGTAINHEFGDVEESGILIDVNEICQGASRGIEVPGQQKQYHSVTFFFEIYLAVGRFCLFSESAGGFFMCRVSNCYYFFVFRIPRALECKEYSGYFAFSDR